MDKYVKYRIKYWGSRGNWQNRQNRGDLGQFRLFRFSIINNHKLHNLTKFYLHTYIFDKSEPFLFMKILLYKIPDFQYFSSNHPRKICDN